MSIYLKGYFNRNLGDDLFFYIVNERYQENFICIAPKKLNLNKIKTIKEKFILKVLRKISHGKLSLEKEIIKKTEFSIIIGGSMFIENDNKDAYDNLLTKNFYVVGANFGPFNSNEYLMKYENFFKKAKDVCFRDSYSYNLFKEKAKVRFAPDIVFSLRPKLKPKYNNRVIISVINCKKKGLQKFSNDYKRALNKIANNFLSKGYKITLMSFCKEEGDEDTIKNLLLSLKGNNVDKYYYNGDINEALKIINSADVIVGSRFHANILGLVYEKKIIPIAYSDKTINTLSDINYTGKIIDIRNINKFNIPEIIDYNLKVSFDKKIVEKKAEMHFLELDKILERTKK